MISAHEHKDDKARTAFMLILFLFLLVGFNSNFHSNDNTSGSDFITQSEVLLKANKAILLAYSFVPDLQVNELIPALGLMNDASCNADLISFSNKQTNTFYRLNREIHLAIKPWINTEIIVCISNSADPLDFPSIS